ncbi:hypothetical protein E2C01_054756 [Portunus trituberculatus]|uniref:Uncharacterized protein n=1 Tax=Portunus trituberculatus TaxID=210409 RepID=A0A5B7GKH9_PORTR|nr:hypothetical protein [Portunus trituberculatus]
MEAFRRRVLPALPAGAYGGPSEGCLRGPSSPPGTGRGPTCFQSTCEDLSVKGEMQIKVRTALIRIHEHVKLCTRGVTARRGMESGRHGGECMIATMQHSASWLKFGEGARLVRLRGEEEDLVGLLEGRRGHGAKVSYPALEESEAAEMPSRVIQYQFNLRTIFVFF